jgi:hypothetical protein
MAKRTSVSDAAELVGTRFWDAVMGGGMQPATAMGPAVSNPEPTVVLGGEAHIHVDDRVRCEAECLDDEHLVGDCEA